MFSNRDLKKLIIPLVIEQVLTALMGTMDTMMVARVGSAAIAGVSLVDSINKLVIFLFSALATGGTIVCSQYLGRGDRKGSDNAGKQVILTAFLLSVFVGAICMVLHKPLLRIIFGTVEQSVMDNAVEYFRVAIIGYPFVSLFGAGSALYRAGGNSRLPMIISVLSNILNVIGNAILIFGCGLGAAGAAIATVISQAVAAVLILIWLRKPGQVIDVGSYLALRPETKTMLRVLSVGLPTGVENAMFQFGKLIVQSTVSTLGTTAIAANAMVVTLELFSSMPSQAIGLGLVTVAGQCIGAGRLDEAKKNIRKLTLWSFIVLLITNWFIYFVTPLVTRVSGMETNAAQLTVQTMLVISIVKPFFWTVAFTPANGMRAAGDVKFNMILTSITMWVCRVGLTTLLCRVLGVGLIGIWCGYFVDWAVRSICFTVRLRGEKWHQHNVI